MKTKVEISEFEKADSKRLKGKSKANGFKLGITRNFELVEASCLDVVLHLPCSKGRYSFLFATQTRLQNIREKNVERS